MRRHIIVTKQWPIPTGGGLGVARQFFLGLAETGVEGRDLLAICGTDVVRIRDAETCRRLAEEPGPPPNRLRATIFQLRAIRRLVSRDTTVIAFTPLYVWPLLRVVCPGSRLVHVEQSKGGRHHELASFRGRFGWKERAIASSVALNFLFPHKVVFPSQGARRLFVEKNPRLARAVENKGLVIPNGVEPVPARIAQGPPGKSPFLILGVCEDVPEKGLGNSLRAIAILRGAGQEVEFHHFGSLGEENRRFAVEQRLPVVFHGSRPRSEVLDAMRRTGLFLHLPDAAVFDLALIEAMSAGLPVVATPVGGNLEALGEGFSHFADSPESAAAEIQKMISNPEDAARAGRALSDRAGNLFSSATMAGRYLEL